MIKPTSFVRFFLLVLLFCAACFGVRQKPARAAFETAYHVRLDISPLAGLGLFNAEFQLTDGSGTGNGNSRVTISNVFLTNAQLGAILPPTSGNASGDLSGVLLLTDGPGPNNSLADFAQGFSVTNANAPAFFDFDINFSLDSIEPSSSTPDNFAFLLLTGDGSQTLPTNGPTGGEVTSAPFDQTAPALQGYTSAPGNTPFLTAPLIVPLANQAAAPEPTSGLLLLIGVGAGAVKASKAARRRNARVPIKG